MKAKDVMTPNVVTVNENTAVEEVAQTLLKWRISAVPVIDVNGGLVGIVSEGDLVRRAESGRERVPPWWLETLADPEQRATDYLKARGRLARDVMTTAVVTVDEDTDLAEIAQILEEHRIKRVPVVGPSGIVGIVSRANLLHGLAASPTHEFADDDRQVRAAIFNRLRNDLDVHLEPLNVTVANGMVHLWGMALSEAQKVAIREVAESTPGVKGVDDHLTVLPAFYRRWMST
jgi:CBS domain-containing protein